MNPRDEDSRRKEPFGSVSEADRQLGTYRMRSALVLGHRVLPERVVHHSRAASQERKTVFLHWKPFFWLHPVTGICAELHGYHGSAKTLPYAVRAQVDSHRRAASSHPNVPTDAL